MKPYLKTACFILLITCSIFKSYKAKACFDVELRKELTPFSDSVSIELLHGQKTSSHLFTNSTANGIILTNSLVAHPLEFYVFDLDGTLIHHTILNPKEKKTVMALHKGIYTYDLFYKDESIEQGKITVK